MVQIPCYAALGPMLCHTIKSHFTCVEKISFTWHYGKVWKQ